MEYECLTGYFIAAELGECQPQQVKLSIPLESWRLCLFSSQGSQQ